MLRKSQQDVVEGYLSDASNMKGSEASEVVLPASVDEMAQILRESSEEGVPVTFSGARTGTVGGALPFGGRIISLDKLNKLGELDTQSHLIEVGAGYILDDFQKHVESLGFLYPPDPTEWSCQIGGTIATNASGARSFKYGATREFVTEIEVVLADGETLNLSRGENTARDGVLEFSSTSGKRYSVPVPTYRRPNVRKNVAGLFSSHDMDAVDLFIGSEGILGVITSAKVRVVPKPESFFSGIVFFPSDENLVDFVEDVRRRSFENRRNGIAGVDATFLEYFDIQSLKLISEKFSDVPPGAECALFFEQETDSDNEERLLGEWNFLFEQHKADLDNSIFTTSDVDREKMKSFRHALPVTVNERVVKNKQRKIGTDMAVPDANFRSFLRFYKQKLSESGLEFVIFGHIGDCHLHVNLLPRNEEEASIAKRLYGRFIAQSLMMGGTVSAEHGIGKHKAKYLHVQLGERYLREIVDIKKVLDPMYILNRGNMISEEMYKTLLLP
jgi:D-lactate dehydrogenase (cytochrome)